MTPTTHPRTPRVPARFEVGAAVTPFARTAGLHAWNRFAAVNDEFVDIHMDDEAGRAAGYSGAIGMGNLVWSWLHVALTDWLGPHGTLEQLACRFKAPVGKGDTVTCTGTVTAVEPDGRGGVVLEIEIWAQNQDGERIAPGTARVRVPEGS